MDNVYLINTQTMEWPVYEGQLAILFPDTSFPSPLVTPPSPYEWVQYVATPQYDWVTQGAREITPINSDGIWYQNWEIYDLSQAQIDANHARQKEQNKAWASTLLQQTDWTCTVDINNPAYSNPYLGNQDAFLSYRSQVRQIAVNPPTVVDVWPTKPEEVWISV